MARDLKIEYCFSEEVARPMIVLFVGMASPAAAYAVGAWLETIGAMDGLGDEFYSRWPLATIGALIGAVTVLHA